MDRWIGLVGVVVFVGSGIVAPALLFTSTSQWHRTFHAQRPSRGCGRCQREKGK